MTAGVEQVTLHTQDGLRLVADVHRPAGAPRGGVVVVHGFGGCRRLPGVVEQARALALRGFLVLAFDSRGHGESAGEVTFGRLAVEDVAAAVDHVRRREALPVVVVGSSLGAATALGFAVTDPGLRGVVLLGLATSWRTALTPRALYAHALARTALGRAVALRTSGARIGRARGGPLRSTDLVRRLRVPVAIVHGRGDRTVRASAAVELFRAAPEPRRLELVDGMSHSYQSAAVPAVVRAVEWAFEQRAVARA